MSVRFFMCMYIYIYIYAFLLLYLVFIGRPAWVVVVESCKVLFGLSLW